MQFEKKSAGIVVKFIFFGFIIVKEFSNFGGMKKYKQEDAEIKTS